MKGEEERDHDHTVKILFLSVNLFMKFYHITTFIDSVELLHRHVHDKYRKKKSDLTVVIYENKNYKKFQTS